MADKEPPDDWEPIDSEQKLRHWLQSAPRDDEQRTAWARGLAVRAALRVFPLALGEMGSANSTTKPAPYYVQRRTLAIWRANFIPWAQAQYPSCDMRAAAIATARQAAGTAAAYSTTSAAKAAHIASHANSAAIDAGVIAANFAVSAATNARRVTADYATSNADASIWQAVEADCRVLASGERRLADYHLWIRIEGGIADPDPKRIPDWVLRAVSRFHQDDTVVASSWSLIDEWYRSVLYSRRYSSARSVFGEENDIWIATQDEAFWAREPIEVLDEIAEHLGWKPRDYQVSSVPEPRPASVKPVRRDMLLVQDTAALSSEIGQQSVLDALTALADEFLELAREISQEGNIDHRPAEFMRRTAELIPKEGLPSALLFRLVRRQAVLVEYGEIVREQWPDFLTKRYGSLVVGFGTTLDKFQEKRAFERHAIETDLEEVDPSVVVSDVIEVETVLRDETSAERVDISIPDTLHSITIDADDPETAELLKQNGQVARTYKADLIESVNNVVKELALMGLEDEKAENIVRKIDKAYVEGMVEGVVDGAKEAGRKDGARIGSTVGRGQTGARLLDRLSERYPNQLGWIKKIFG